MASTDRRQQGHLTLSEDKCTNGKDWREEKKKENKHKSSREYQVVNWLCQQLPCLLSCCVLVTLSDLERHLLIVDDIA